MSDFIEVIGTEGFESGTMQEVEVDGRKLLVAHVGDEFLITDARCPHLGGHLGRNKLEGTVVTCPLHHSQFDLRDGSCLRWTDWKGAVLSIAELARHPRPLRAYQSKVDGGKVFVGPEKSPGSVPE